MRSLVSVLAKSQMFLLAGIMAASLGMGGCKKLSQDVQIIETASVGGGSGGDNDDGEDYTDEFGAEYYLGSPSTEVNAISGLFLGEKRNLSLIHI